ncbi:Aste57867_20027 [Aphanomyces stellatus]|uniref:Aste57867_20027 protein n=1 Tax=Aphanomyces stellatus TaxID=120398 RepID=A0A485LE20_9STRA|nr:hypothetical protein As57867_019961 [Aphanomyces stellatus]VFT96723.1 Aste57867_20027 [Aphanomyces stellatus]
MVSFSNISRFTNMTTLEAEKAHFVNIQTPRAGDAFDGIEAPKLTLEWKHINMSIKLSKKRKTNPNVATEKHILRDVSGTASPGQLVIVMGPSGAGKTCMLDTIAGRNSNFTGSVTVNGQKWTSDFNSLASYVMQDDVFYPTLTVKEHLMYQAELRMGKTFNAVQREARVDYVINELGLTKCRDSQIGGGAWDSRGLSGGERKRLSFATEILTNPSLLFVDEPTSGLDSFMAESVILQLQKLARAGRTVVATIHQPSSELFAHFDQLYLLSDGQTIYNGNASDAIAYFASQGLQCPNFMNPTDYFMRQIVVLDPQSQAADRVEELVNAWKARVANESSIDGDVHPDPVHQTYETSRLGIVGQLGLLCRRNVTRLVRDTLSFKARVAQNLFISIVVGLIYFQLKKDQPGIQSYTGALFFITVFQFIGNAMPEFSNVPSELPIMIREYHGGLYHAWVWYLAKTISELSFQVLFPLVFLTPIYFMIGIGGDTGVFFTFYLFLALMCSAAVGLGYMVGCITKRVDIAQILGVITALPLVIFGGLFINSNTTPAYFVWLEYISPLKYGFRGLSRAFWNSVATIPCAVGEHCQATTGTQVLANLGLNKNSMFVDVVALLCVNLLFRIIGLLWLWLSIRRRN